jgi:hypothetical protein
MSFEILPRYHHFEITYVNPKHKVVVPMRGRDKHVYQWGHDVVEGDIDFEAYNTYFEKKGYPPPINKVSDVHIDPDRIKPGLELFLSDDFVRHWMCGLFDVNGLDSYSCDARTTTRKRFVRQKVNPQVTALLNDELYSVFDMGRSAFSGRIVDLVQKYCPKHMLQVHALMDPKSKMVPFSVVDWDAALSNGVHIGIDWVYADRVLGFMGLLYKKHGF